MLKFEDKFNVSDKIKAYHFQPSEDRPDSYLVGYIVGTDETAYKSFKVVMTENVYHGKPVDLDNPDNDPEALVPMEVSEFMEFDNRITLV